MKSIRHALGALVLVASLSALPTLAASYSADQSDLWYIQAESGWGMQLVQRDSTIFATLFVYAQTTSPTWYVATMNPTGTPLVWMGNLYATTGPWFGMVPFTPALVHATLVGTMTWTGQTVNTGNVSYSVNGVVVSKNVIRQTLVNENYSGHFGGGIHETLTGCASLDHDVTREFIGVLDITQVGATVTLTAPATGGSCAYSGTLTQFGQMGDVVGTFSCSPSGDVGLFHIFEFQVTEVSVTGHFTASYDVFGCQSVGWFGGMTVTTF